MQRNTFNFSFVGLLAMVATFESQAVQAQHADDLHIGQSGGVVALHPGGLEALSEYHFLLRVDDPFPGWSNNEPGFESASQSQDGVIPLSPGHEIWLEVVALDPGLLIVPSAFELLEQPGDETLLGGHDLHAHLTFFVDESHPDFDSASCAWRGTLKLTEAHRLLGDSAPFTLMFSTIPVREEDDPATGDFDGIEGISLKDHRAFEICLSSPDVFPTPDDPDITTCEVDCHNAFDFDNDLDVDLRDYAEFQTMFGP